MRREKIFNAAFAHMKKYCFISYILICAYGNGYAQKRNNIWAFGDSIGINFNTNPVSPFRSVSPAFTPPYYLSSICSKDGGLLFYTDGITMWNRDNFKLPKYNNWWPWYGNVLPLVIPYVSNDSLYYIFGIDDEGDENGNSFKLQYVSTKMYNPGDIEEAVYPRPPDIRSYYTTLLSNASHVLAGTGHCNQVDTWITTHSPGGLYSFLITKSGVNPSPVVTPVSSAVLPNKRLNVSNSNIKFSANGERLIIPDNDNDKIVVFDFDNQTGKFANPKVLSIPQGETLEGVEISADASKLYFGSFEVTDPEVDGKIHFLYQMDLNAGDANAIEKTLYKVNYGDRTVCFHSCSILHRTMQMGPDGRIYVSRKDYVGLNFETTLGVIEDPQKAGADCHYVGTEVDLKKKVTFLNYNYIRSASFTPRQNSIQFRKSTCVDQPVDFSVIFTRIDSVKWNFGDPESGSENFSTLIKPSHQYPGPGTYTVRALVFDRCFQDTAYASVTISEDKIVRIPASLTDTVSCLGGEILLDATTPYAEKYVWADGATTPQRSITKAGDYTVTGLNACSSDTKTIKVILNECPCKVYIPNAFTPNNDHLNDKFGPIFDCQPDPLDFELKIYDRYGGVVFQTTNISIGWDGRKRETEMPAGVYLWTVQYHNPATKELVRQKGTVTLLR